MAKSEAAKALEAKQKAARRAEKERRRNSEDPRDWGWWKQITYAYKATAKVDKKLNLWMAGAFAVPVLLAILVAALTGGTAFSWVLWIITGVVAGFTLAVFILTNRMKRATLEQARGQVGSAAAALGLLNTKIWTHDLGIAGTRQQDLIHRAIGPAGVVLIGEGEPGRLKQLLAAEERKHAQLTADLPVWVVQMGTKEGQVSLDDLAKHIRKLPKSLDKYQVTEVRSRVKALDAVRPRVPLPKGPMPTSARQARGSRRALRGR
ncbi:protein of unknown function [Raineyella antarctica]|uniref:DUF4191 domain-containing protein n=1 Tax=Raineyella antarctica TaxID=1577474 RepID=A0A1G6GDM0_9ACTN|nr:DUF4191 domain-containing protein [Raineyella antarctica]SDB80102.1 protein of unknown function [Raineyella antarctica]